MFIIIQSDDKLQKCINNFNKISIKQSLFLTCKHQMKSIFDRNKMRNFIIWVAE